MLNIKAKAGIVPSVNAWERKPYLIISYFLLLLFVQCIIICCCSWLEFPPFCGRRGYICNSNTPKSNALCLCVTDRSRGKQLVKENLIMHIWNITFLSRCHTQQACKWICFWVTLWFLCRFPWFKNTTPPLLLDWSLHFLCTTAILIDFEQTRSWWVASYVTNYTI